MADFDGVRLKVARAGEHLAEIKAGLDEWRKSKPYAVVAEVDAKTGDQRFKVDSDPAPPPSLPAIGDALYNLRSALDLLAWQLVLKTGGTPGTNTEFPIFNDPVRFKEPRCQSKMAGMSYTMKQRIESHQPCFGRNPNRNVALWGLQEYGNTDKHRTLLVIPVSTQDMLWQPGGNPTSTHKGLVSRGTVLAQFPPDQHQSFFSAMPSVAFKEPPRAGEDVYYELYFMQHVVNSITEEFERDFL